MKPKVNLHKIFDGVYALDRGIWIPKEKVFVIGDLHMGYEESLNKQGVLIPRHQFKLTKELLEKMLKSIGPETIVINGDLKHEFGEISVQEWRETLKILDLLSGHSKKIILVKGNHDTILGPIARKRNLSVVDFYCVGDICITHGHKIWKDKEFQKAKTIIISNEHPAVSIKEGVKSELYKCFHVGKWKRKRLIVMPSFLPIVEGSDVKRERFLSPYLHQLSKFEVLVVGDKVYKFGKLRDLE